MRYIGILESGNERITVERLTRTISDPNKEVIIPGNGSKVVTGRVFNPSKTSELIVSFYSQNREEQELRLGPQEEIVLKNQPCDRLFFRIPDQTNYFMSSTVFVYVPGTAFFEYQLRVFSLEGDSELFVFLADSWFEIRKSTVDRYEYTYIGGIIPDGNFQVLASSIPTEDHIIDRIRIVGQNRNLNAIPSDMAVNYNMYVTQTSNFAIIGYYGSLATSGNSLIAEDNEVLIPLASNTVGNPQFQFSIQAFYGDAYPTTDLPFLIFFRYGRLIALDARLISKPDPTVKPRRPLVVEHEETLVELYDLWRKEAKDLDKTESKGTVKPKKNKNKKSKLKK